MRTPPYLTKSRFKLGLECLTKLYYTAKTNEYEDLNQADPFLEALAKGGYQVGELAKYMFCNNPQAEGITVEERGYDASVAETNGRLQAEDALIAEAAFRHGNLFVRVDILKRAGNVINIYEVKSKSYEPNLKGIEAEFLSYAGKAKEKVNSEWEPYLYDLAFQKHVVEKAMGPEFKVKAHLILADKSKRSTVDGINQKFKVVKNEEGGFKVIIEDGLTAAALGEHVLTILDVDDIIEKVRNAYPVPTDYSENIGFNDFIELCEEIYINDRQQFTTVGSKCKSCQFRNSEEGETAGLKSGFMECWTSCTGLDREKLKSNLVLDLWGGNSGSRSYPDECVSKNIFLLKDVTEDIIAPASSRDDSPGLSNHERRMLQINKVAANDSGMYFDKEGFQAEMENWKWPLNFIDFETSTGALPFHRGSRPYDELAFQFSHHLLHEDGRVEHKTQFIHAERGQFPNLHFIRALKEALSQNDGTIFRYHSHERTYLGHIHEQIVAGIFGIDDAEKNELISFIETIALPGKGNRGPREMEDLYKLVLRYYYSPFAGGRNGLKYILPAIIRDSPFLQDKYGKPGVYGKQLEVKSLNFDDHVWVSEAHGFDPYRTLPSVFSDYDKDQLESLVSEMDELADGGAALAAYNCLQFSEVPDDQRARIIESLYRYCELDTMAMVKLIEGWMHWE